MKTYNEILYETTPKDERPIIMVDLDGVLVDLNKGVEDLTGGFDMTTWKTRGKSMADKKGNVPPEVSNQRLHDMITAAGPKFWAELPWMSDGKKLWSFLRNHEVHVLSAYRKPRNDPKAFSKKGKTVWVTKNLKLAPAKTHLVIRDQKKDYVTHEGRKCILIDDYPKNIKEFNAKGGDGIVHTSASKTISKLKKMGFK